jgi:hypothetical protein
LLFDAQAPTVVAHSHRRLHSKSMPSRSKYINSLYEYCTTHNIFSRIQALDHDPSTTKAESIDDDMTKGMLAAEKTCRQRSQDPWSIAIQQAYLLVDIYKHALSMVRIGLESHYKLQRLLSRYSIPLDIPDSVSDIQKALRSAQKSLRTLRSQAAEERRKMLQAKIISAQVTQDSKQSRLVKRIAQAEDMKALHAKLRFLSKDSDQQSGLKRLEVPVDPSHDPKQCTEWMTVDTPEDITKYLLERNQKHFRQAKGTPFTVSPLDVQVDFGASTAFCEAMLTGDYDTRALDDLTALLVSNFQALTQRDVLSSAITSKEMMDKYKFWPESTTTSPSGRHLGHYRALLLNLSSTTVKKKGALERKREALVAVHHALLSFALSHGYSYSPWQKVVNVMLEKEPGNRKIHRLRVIHLYEADYNLILGVKWRQLIHHCEDNQLLHSSLYGARPGRGALEPVFIEELINEITRMSRKPLQHATIGLFLALVISPAGHTVSIVMWQSYRAKHWKRSVIISRLS